MAVLSRNGTNKNQKVSVGPAVLVVAMDSAVGSSTAGPIGFANNSTAPYHGSVNRNITNNSSRIDLMARMAPILPEHEYPNRTQVHAKSGLDDIPLTTGPIFPHEEKLTTTSSKKSTVDTHMGIDLVNAFKKKCETPLEHALKMPRRFEEVFTERNVSQSYRGVFHQLFETDISILRDAILQCQNLKGVSQEDIDCCLKLLDVSNENQCDDVWTKFRKLPGLNRKVAKIIKGKMTTDFFKIKNELWERAKKMYRWNSDETQHYKDAYDLALVIMEETRVTYGNYNTFFQLSHKVRELQGDICGAEKDECEKLADMLTSVGWSDYWVKRGVEALECKWEDTRLNDSTYSGTVPREWKAYLQVSESKSDRDALKAFFMSRRSHLLSMTSRIKSSVSDTKMKKFAGKMENVVNVWEAKPIKAKVMRAQLDEYDHLLSERIYQEQQRELEVENKAKSPSGTNDQ